MSLLSLYLDVVLLTLPLLMLPDHPMEKWSCSRGSCDGETMVALTDLQIRSWLFSFTGLETSWELNRLGVAFRLISGCLCKLIYANYGLYEYAIDACVLLLLLLDIILMKGSPCLSVFWIFLARLGKLWKSLNDCLPSVWTVVLAMNLLIDSPPYMYVWSECYILALVF